MSVPDTAGMADPEVLASKVRSWGGDWGEEATFEVIDYVSELEKAASYDLAFLDRVPHVLAAPWRSWIAETQVQNGGYYQYFWNGYAPIARATATDFELIGAAALASVQRDAAAAFERVAPRLDGLRALPSPPYGQAGPYQEGLKIEDFAVQDEAWSREYDPRPIIDLISEWLPRHADLIAGAILATRALPGAS